MKSIHRLAASTLAFVALSACVEDSAPPSSTPSIAEQACLRDVTRTTNNPDVTLLSSEFSQAGTKVIVGVGAQRAPWSCIGYGNGTTAAITSLTNEGAL